MSTIDGACPPDLLGDKTILFTEAKAERPKRSALVQLEPVAGRALVAVIAIMSFLGALTLGAVVLVRSSAAEWQATVAREITVQIRPVADTDTEKLVAEAVQLVAARGGIAEVRPYSREESARLLEPWLGSGLAMDDLPVPRLIVVKAMAGEQPDLNALRESLASRIPGSSLDDHRGWIAHMRRMTQTAVGIGTGILVLVLGAAMLSVTFATRGAMASNRATIEVLHLIGARDGFIAAEFQQHFLFYGFLGAALGAALAVLGFMAAAASSRLFQASAAEEQAASLFGSFALGWAGYAGLVGLIVLVAAATAGTSRLTVHRTLRAMG